MKKGRMPSSVMMDPAVRKSQKADNRLRMGSVLVIAVGVSKDARHAASLELIQSVLPAKKGVRSVGVTVSNFDAPASLDDPALLLFEEAGNTRAGRADDPGATGAFGSMTNFDTSTSHALLFGL